MAHSEYYWLTDRNRPGGVLAFDPGEGWVDFLAPVTVADRLWSGAPAERPGVADRRTSCRRGCRRRAAAARPCGSASPSAGVRVPTATMS